MSRIPIAALAVLLLAPIVCPAQPMVVPIAGSSSGFDADSGTVAAARFNFPIDVAIDSQGRLLVCDQNNHRIRRLDLSANTVVTVAGSGPVGGSNGAFSGDGGLATQARLNGPRSVALDGADNIYICDSGNHRVRRVDARTGRIDSIAGSGPTTGSFSGDGGPATQARLNTPQGVTVDAAGNVFFGDRLNHRVRRIDAGTGVIKTIAGSSLPGGGDIGEFLSRGNFGGDGGPATEALLDAPLALIFDRQGNLYIGDHRNDRVRVVDASTGLIRTVIGSSARAITGDGTPGTRAFIGSPAGLALEADGTLYVAPFNNRIYKLDGATGQVFAVAGSPFCFGQSAGDNGPALEACINGARGIALDAAGDLVFCEPTGGRVRKLLLRSPRIASVTPDTFSNAAPAVLTLRGSDLDDVRAASLSNGTQATALTTISSSELQVTIPSGVAIGVYSLVLQVPGGTNGATGVRVRVQAPSVTDNPPRAVIEIPPFRFEGEPTKLDGSASFDPDAGDTISYRWSVTTTVAGAPALDSTSPAVTYGFQNRGDYRFDLTVTSSRGNTTATSTVFFRLSDQRPFAVIARGNETFILPDRRGIVPASITTDTILLDGRNTLALDGDPLTYAWTLESKPQGSQATTASAILDSNNPVTRFRLSAALGQDGRLRDAGDYVVFLTVADAQNNRSTAGVRISALGADDVAPTADAGLDRNVEARLLSASPLALAAEIPDPLLTPPNDRSAFVRLDGRNSVDPNVPPLPITYSWTLLEAPRGSGVGALLEADTAAARFVPDRPGVYRARLVVSNALFTGAPSDVRVLVKLRGLNPPPAAQALARNLAGTVRTSLTTPVPIFLAGADTVVLDGSGTVSAGPGSISAYRWTQLSGPPAALSPSSTAPVVTFVPPSAGRYVFQLQVSDDAGNAGASDLATLQAIPAGQRPLGLRLVSRGSSGAATGADVPDGVLESSSGSLRVTLPVLVSLTGTVARAPGRRVSFLWRQVVGPQVSLSGAQLLNTTSPSSVAQFAPTTSRLHEFECRAIQLDAQGAPTGIEDARRIRVLADAADNGVPIAVARTRAGKTVVSPCSEISLDGALSVDVGANATDLLRFRWTQTAGPPVVLSNPFAAVTTFVAPDLGDGRSRDYAFQLFVEDGRGRSEPSAAAISVTSGAAGAGRVAGLPLSRGLALVSVPIDVDGSFDSSDLARATRARFVARAAAGRFEVFFPGAGAAPFPVEAGRGYLLGSPATPGSTSVTGQPWADSLRSASLSPGLNLVAYSAGVPPGETAATLAQLTGSAFVAQVAPTAAGAGRFQVYLPGVSNAFELIEGRGYLVSVPSARTVTWPPDTSGCR